MQMLTLVATLFIPLTFLVGRLWNEFRAYAGIAMALWLFPALGYHVAIGYRFIDLFPQKKLDVIFSHPLSVFIHIEVDQLRNLRNVALGRGVPF